MAEKTKGHSDNTSERMRLPCIEQNTAVLEKVTVPVKRAVLFVVVPRDQLDDQCSDSSSFNALSWDNKALFQLLLYAVYCCKGQVLQVTLEQPDLITMCLPLREDFAHGRLFCFVLNTNMDTQTTGELGIDDETEVDDLLDSVELDVDMDVFRDGEDDDDHTELTDELYKAFMRLQLVRKQLVSTNNAMVLQRDVKKELTPLFASIDVEGDALHAANLDRKLIRELQGTVFTQNVQTGGRQAFVLPESMARLNMKTLERAVGRLTDSVTSGVGERLFHRLVRKLTKAEWTSQETLRKYSPHIPGDVNFVANLKRFTTNLADGHNVIETNGLIVFQYTLDTLINKDEPDAFVRTLLHRHVPVSRIHILSTLGVIRSKKRTAELAQLLNNGTCRCSNSTNTMCSGRCEKAYVCFYNESTRYPFQISKDEHGQYFAQLYPHLAQLERLSNELKDTIQRCKRFELIADMVFDMLVKKRTNIQTTIYSGIGAVVSERMLNSDMSLGRHVPDIHLKLCSNARESAHHPLKMYDLAVIRYLFVKQLQVGRLFQASTTFNYIITNTAPRYTIERIMLLNITGPGEGKSYANNVLTHQFRRVPGCVETLTSFTPQAFKYKQNRTSSVVIIDDAHVTHEKTTKAVDRESNVIPNTFKNLLDHSVLESEVVAKNAVTGRSDTVSYQAVHNCGFVWNTNTMGFISEAWADRCLVMESEYSAAPTRTRSSKQLLDTVVGLQMDCITQVCLYRQNLIQCATMIADSDAMQFTERYDKARQICIEAVRRTHIVCEGITARRIESRINQLVYAEAMKLACHYVFDLWIPPWTDTPKVEDSSDLESYMQTVNVSRLSALDKLTFGQLTLEVNVVYKLCVAACLPDICPRVLDMQARFACKSLGYLLTQVKAQGLKTTMKNATLQICIEGMIFDEDITKGGCDGAHEQLLLCADCKVPSRCDADAKPKRNKLCTCKLSSSALSSGRKSRGVREQHKKVSSVHILLETVYDMLALYARESHVNFWTKLTAALVASLASESENVNALAHCRQDEVEDSEAGRRHLTFTLDFTDDPIQSLILEATVGVPYLNEITFNKSATSDSLYHCSAPLCYAGVLVHALGDAAPRGAHDANHVRESKVGPNGTFHGPRLTVYSLKYYGVPVKNISSFCTSRTVYHQDQITLRHNKDDREYLFHLDADWEWKDAVEVMNRVKDTTVFTTDLLKLDYSLTMAHMERAYRRRDVLTPRPDGHVALSQRTGQSASPLMCNPMEKRTHVYPDSHRNKRMRTSE